MKKIILFLLVRIFVLFLVATAGAILDFIFTNRAHLFNIKGIEEQINFDLFALEMGLLILLGIPYILYLITFKLIRKKRTSIIVRGIFTGLISYSLNLLAVNTLTMGERPNILDLYILIPSIIFFISGFSLPYVDEFFMKKFGLKKAE